MSLPRKRKAGTLKPGSIRSKSLRSAEGECGTVLPADECGTVLPADVLPQTPTHRAQSSKVAKEGDSEGQLWRRSPRLQGLSPASFPEGLTQIDRDHAEGPSEGEAEGQEAEQALVITLDESEGHGRGRRSGRRKGGGKRRRANDPLEEETQVQEEQEEGGEEEEQEEVQPELQIDRELDRDLENKSRQHRLTSANVRSIIHEVITNEHVVAMMKAAINETEPVPVFEPKMTRSKLKEVVERGVVIPTWNISPIKKPSEAKAPQFVDIPLEEEDSSDEEYCPDDDDEDETAEETLLESDLESTASSPRGSRSIHRVHDEDRNSGSHQLSRRSGHVRVEVVPMGPPPPPQPAPGPPAPPRPSRESSFMEKLHAVDEELAFSSHCIEPYQTLGGGGAEGVMAFRTRSKRPLRDVPLEELEAELRAPDFTPDLYDMFSAHEDREWTHWLQGLMSSMSNEEEVDDDDDPEYNFLADTDEPDVEDYRNDRAVRITKKEVNELMEELFETFQEDLAVPEEEEVHEEVEEEEEKEEDTVPAAPPTVSILHTVQYENPLADVLNESYRTVREQLAALRRRRALLESRGIAWPPPSSEPPPPPLLLTHTQKLHLQQQVQQHVQLLTQVIMLCSPVDRLKTETSTARQFLVRTTHTHTHTRTHTPILPNKPTSGRRFPILPPHLAWLMATRPAFMYPELLPHVSLDPAHHASSTSKIKSFTLAEDCLIVLGHKHFSGTARPLKMAAHYLLAAKTVTEINKHVYDVSHRLPNHVVTSYFQQKKVPSMPQPCRQVEPSDRRPPVEKDENTMPLWLWKSLQAIYKAVQHHAGHQGGLSGELAPRSSPAEGEVLSSEPPASSSCPKTLLPPPPPRPYSFPPGTRYPASLPERLVMQPSGFKWVPSPPRPRACQSKPRRPQRRQRLFTATWRQEGKLQPIQPAPSPSLTPPIPRALAGRGATVCVRGRGGPVCVRGRGGSVCVRARGGSVCVTGQGGPLVGSITPTLGLGGLILNLPVSAPLVCPTPPAMPPALGLAPLAPRATPLGKSVVSQHCSTLMGLHKLPTFPSAHSVTQVPQLVLVPSGLLLPNPTPLPLATAAKAQARTLRRSNQSQKEVQGEVWHVPTEEAQGTVRMEPQAIAGAGGGAGGGGPSEKRTIVPEEEEAEEEEGQREEEEVEEEEGYGSGEGDEGPFLMLSESSGSPTPSLSSCTDAMVTEIDREDSHSEATEGRTEEDAGNRRTQKEGGDGEAERDEVMNVLETMSSASEESVLSVPELQVRPPDVMSRHVTLPSSHQAMDLISSRPHAATADETIERLSWLAWEGRCDAEKRSGEEKSLKKTSSASVLDPDGERAPSSGDKWTAAREVGFEEAPVPLSEDAGVNDDPQKDAGIDDDPRKDAGIDDDPRKETKEVAFAQAYLEKVREALQVVPGKVEEFLGVLNVFEREPEGRTPVELYQRLRPLLQHWPELLQDFAAFLQPEQAHQCGLLVEQQAFERSRRFLRQLELSFGESSTLYRKVVKILRGGTNHGGIVEVKAQISTLLGSHSHLLEEFWVFFHQLYPQVSESPQLEEKKCPNAEAEHQDNQPITSLIHAQEEDHRNSRPRSLGRRKRLVFPDTLDTGNTRERLPAQQSLLQDAENAASDPEIVCAKNISLMPSGERVVLWTREADRAILTACQQKGANQKTFSAVSAQLGNKTANEVCSRFHDLMRLFHTSSKQRSSESDSDTDTDTSSSSKDEPD
ncbi:GON-4-like protein [Alosa alosa]|uniref:GON-4-like protein n=1 Tax=Alosa alosa TaxID=278164 RepID=UPI0020150459|nr:GON-4-like protein [Alosa alosa]